MVRAPHSDALSALKFARQLGIWFHRAYGKKPDFKPGPFLPPREPVDATAALTKEIEELRKRIAESEDAAGRARREAEEHARARETAEERWKREAEERAIWEQLAQETEAEKARLMTHGSALRSLPLESAEAAHLDALQAAAAQAPKSDILELIARGEEAATKIDLDEADTRALIDQQLRDSGWEVDTQSLRHSNSTRPVKGRNLAIAEWPTASGPADYALFVGLTLVGVVEGKRRRKNVRPASQLKEFAANLSASAAAFLNIYLRRPSSSRHELNAVPSCNGFGITLSSGSCPPPEKYFLFDDGGV